MFSARLKFLGIKNVRILMRFSYEYLFYDNMQYCA